MARERSDLSALKRRRVYGDVSIYISLYISYVNGIRIACIATKLCKSPAQDVAHCSGDKRGRGIVLGDNGTVSFVLWLDVVGTLT